MRHDGAGCVDHFHCAVQVLCVDLAGYVLHQDLSAVQRSQVEGDVPRNLDQEIHGVRHSAGHLDDVVVLNDVKAGAGGADLMHALGYAPWPTASAFAAAPARLDDRALAVVAPNRHATIHHVDC